MIIDAWAQLMTTGRSGAFERYGRLDQLIDAGETERIIADMDENDIDVAVLAGFEAMAHKEFTEFTGDNKKVCEALDKHPDRFVGAIQINRAERISPNVRDIDALVRNHNFKVLRLEPFMLHKNPDESFFYPFYAKAAELEIAVQIQVGNTGSRFYPMEPGRPIHVDKVAMDFPELRIICGHLGWPWTDEMIAVAWRHENLYIDTSAHVPKHIPESFIHYMKSFGKRKVLFASGWPLLPYQRLRKEYDQLNLSPEVKALFFADNAKRAFQL